MATLGLSAPALASNGGTAVPNTAPAAASSTARRCARSPRARCCGASRSTGGGCCVRVDRTGAGACACRCGCAAGHANHLLTRTIRTGPPRRDRAAGARARALDRAPAGDAGCTRVRRGRIVVHGVHQGRPPPPPPPADGGVFPVAGPAQLRRRHRRAAQGPPARGPGHHRRAGHPGRRAAGRHGPLRRLPGRTAPATTSSSRPPTGAASSSPTARRARSRSRPGEPGDRRAAGVPRRPQRRRTRPAPALRDLAGRLAGRQEQPLHRPAAGAQGLGLSPLSCLTASNRPPVRN